MLKMLLLWVGVIAVAQASAAPLRDGGIDPSNLGQGDWISFFQFATNNFRDPDSTPDIVPVRSVVDIKTALEYEKKLGMDYVIVKAGTGSTNYMLGNERQFTTNLVQLAHAAGLKIFGYTRSYGYDVPGEIEIATYVFNCGADGFVIDAEAEWESNRPWIGNKGPQLARQLCEGIRARFPNKFLAHSPMPVISFHRSFPYKEFGLYCDAVMPQLYWRSFEKTPTDTVKWMDTEWRAWYAGLRGTDTNAIKPIVPVGPGGPGMRAVEIIEFMNYLKSDPQTLAHGYRGVNWFRAGRYPAEVLHVFREINFHNGDSWKSFSNVRTSGVTANRATVFWSGRNTARAKLEYGTTTNYGSTLFLPTPQFTHTADLTNLVPDTIYHFRIVATNSANAVETSADFLLMTRNAPAAPPVIIDNLQATATGAWTTSTSAKDIHGRNYQYKPVGDGRSYLEFGTNMPATGFCYVSTMHTQGENRTTKAQIIMSAGGQSQTNYVDQKAKGGVWNVVGLLPVQAGQRLSVRVTDDAKGKGVVVGDAVKIEYAPGLMSPP